MSLGAFNGPPTTPPAKTKPLTGTLQGNCSIIGMSNTKVNTDSERIMACLALGLSYVRLLGSIISG